MKYTIFGFSQAKLIELGLDVEDALLLRYFIDFKDSGKMSKELFEKDVFYWVNYDSIKKELPILNISKDRVYRKLKKITDAGVLIHETKKSGGTFSFYAIGRQYNSLISSDNSTSKIPEGTVKIPEGTVKIPEGMVKKPEGYGKNTGEGTVKIPEQNINLLNNPSTKDIYIKVIDYLNSKAGTNYKSTSKKTQQLIQARLNEKFMPDDFKKVIDKKCIEWLGTEFEKFLRPETLFGAKFEGYLNQKNTPAAKNNNKDSTFKGYNQRPEAAETYKQVIESQQKSEEEEEHENTKAREEFYKRIGCKAKDG